MKYKEAGMIERLYRWAFLYDQEPFEVYSIFLKVLTAVLFLTITPDRLADSRVLSSINSIIPIIWLGILTAIIAAFHIFAMLQRNWVVRKTALMISIMYWIFIFLVYYLNGAVGITILMVPTLSLFLTWAYLRMAVIQRAEQRKGVNG